MTHVAVTGLMLTLTETRTMRVMMMAKISAFSQLHMQNVLSRNDTCCCHRPDAHLDRDKNNEGDDDGQNQRLLPVAHAKVDDFGDEAAMVLWLHDTT